MLVPINSAHIHTRKRNIDEIYEQDALPKEHVMYLESLDIKPKVVYDIGACVKHWARHAERIWDSKVFLFDANMNLRKLYNRVGNEYFLGVLSDENKVVKFYEDEFNLGGNSYYKENTVHYNESHAKLVDATTLNDVVYERDWPLPDMIKLDVQGAEVDILKGASKILKNCTDIILEAQVIDYNSGAPKENEVIEFMKSIGYKLKIKITNNKTDNDYHFIKM
jgi:FkbM family methyltransferase